MSVKKDTLYPVADIHRIAYQRNMRAEWTGEFRNPKKGEWYLSGAFVEAYYAPDDLDYPYHIAKIFKTETVTITRKV